MGFRRKQLISIGYIKRQMKNDLMVRFSRAFYGGGNDYDKAVAAFEVADWYEAFGRSDVAYLYERVAEFYNFRHWNNEAHEVASR